MTTPPMSVHTEGHTAAAVVDREVDSLRTTVRRPLLSGIRGIGIATVIFTVVSLIVWWNVWTDHPSATTICGCGDPSLFTWFLAWPAHAIAHGENPLYSTTMFYPGGVNLLSNTSEPLLGIVLAPITWLFGPIATLNVALIVCPVLSALGMFVLLRRWVRWLPAAVIGGVVYGFSPFLLLNLTTGWLMVSFGVVPPLILICLDEILIRQTRKPIAVGILLGFLVGVQFFIGTEMLLIVMVCIVLGLILLVAYAALRRPDALRGNARYAAVGLGAGIATAIVLLAYPFWFAFAGPAHLGGKIWPTSQLQFAGVSLKSLLWPTPPLVQGLNGSTLNHRIGGYQGPVLSAYYVGIGMPIVLIGGLVAFWRDRKMWFFAAMTAVSLVLAYGARLNYDTPWGFLAHLPQFENIIPNRFLLVTWLSVSVLLGLILDHTYATVRHWQGVHHRPNGLRTGREGGPRRWPAALAAGLVACVAVVPPIWYLAGTVPFTAQPVTVPTWLRTVAPTLSPHQVLLVVPIPSGLMESAATWQAVEGMTYSMVEGPGPGGVPARAGAQGIGANEISMLSFFNPDKHSASVFQSSPIRSALRAWGVTTIVIPDQTDLPLYVQLPSVTLAAALISAATGERPVFQNDAWVWRNVDQAVIGTSTGPSTVTSCITGLPLRGPNGVNPAVTCVLGRSQ